MSEFSLEQAVIPSIVLPGETQPAKILDVDGLVKAKGVFEISFSDFNVHIAPTALRVFRQHYVYNRAGDEPDCHEYCHGYQ
jgi:hypothetical protein